MKSTDKTDTAEQIANRRDTKEIAGRIRQQAVLQYGSVGIAKTATKAILLYTESGRITIFAQSELVARLKLYFQPGNKTSHRQFSAESGIHRKIVINACDGKGITFEAFWRIAEAIDGKGCSREDWLLIASSPLVAVKPDPETLSHLAQHP
jgi:hypothetical protein